MNYLRKMFSTEFLYGWRKAFRSYINSLRAYLAFLDEFNKFKKMPGSRGRFRIEWDDMYPCLNDRTEETGFDRHYVYHPAWQPVYLRKLDLNVT